MLVIIGKMQKPFKYHCWPEKTANIVQGHSILITCQYSNRRAFELVEANFPHSTTFRRTTKTWVVHVISMEFIHTFLGGHFAKKQWWLPEMTAVYSGYSEGRKESYSAFHLGRGI